MRAHNLSELQKFFLMVAIFLGLYFFPVGIFKIKVLYEATSLVKWYAREHVLLCLIPAFFIAGGISVFVKKGSVLKYFGPQANKILSYSVACVSGTILAVCSCTVPPLFAGIYRHGAGLGPASTFLFSGPAINILAIIMTARILGWQIGIARTLSAVIMAIFVGLLMHTIFIREERQRQIENAFHLDDSSQHQLWHFSFLHFYDRFPYFCKLGRTESSSFWFMDDCLPY